MAFRISDLTAIASATIDPTTDVLELSDISAGAGGSRKVTPNNLVNIVLTAPGPIGATTPSTGAFTSASATGSFTAGAAGMFIFSGLARLGANSAATLKVFQNDGVTTGNIIAGGVNFLSLTDNGKSIAGSTGAITQNSATGQVQFAAAATSLVVTNSMVTANSIIVAMIGSVDASAVLNNVVAAAGSFTLSMKAAPATTTKVNYHVTN